MIIKLCPLYWTPGLKAPWKVSNIMDARTQEDIYILSIPQVSVLTPLPVVKGHTIVPTPWESFSSHPPTQANPSPISTHITTCFVRYKGSKYTVIYIYIYLYLYIYNCVFGSFISNETCSYVSADGGRVGLCCPALLGHWFSYTGCWQSLPVMF